MQEYFLYNIEKVLWIHVAEILWTAKSLMEHSGKVLGKIMIQGFAGKCEIKLVHKLCIISMVEAQNCISGHGQFPVHLSHSLSLSLSVRSSYGWVMAKVSSLKYFCGYLFLFFCACFYIFSRIPGICKFSERSLWAPGLRKAHDKPKFVFGHHPFADLTTPPIGNKSRVYNMSSFAAMEIWWQPGNTSRNGRLYTIWLLYFIQNMILHSSKWRAVCVG
jgi:hypothetical protein